MHTQTQQVVLMCGPTWYPAISTNALPSTLNQQTARIYVAAVLQGRPFQPKFQIAKTRDEV